ncbi:Aryl hydrocarbon receptor [Acipenser ruthenus]|uniref:Aryl hydrocarbon receptor n=1 Tax=Acipenser ruthenus TaxID=7906 RepID=A0A662YQV6_ACIRT|nr:Aryl hydrocarbon receptor [Acipenser ruthenus]
MKKNNVGWLREKPGTFGGDGQSVPQTNGTSFSEGDLLLQALNGFVLVVTAEGYVFYSSPTIQDYLGFHQSDVVHQSVFELIHTDDRAMFRRQLHFALNPNSFESEQGTELMQSGSNSTGLSNIVNYDPQLIPPENSSFLERSFCCRFRCLLDNSSGFLYSLDKAMDDTTIVNVLGDPWIPGNHRQNANIKEESETLAMMEALEKLFNGNDLQHVDGLELKHWEETLFKMDINNSEMSLELNDILNNDIFAYVEDALFKEQCKPNNNGKDNGRSSINSLANQMDSIGVVQPNLFEGQLLNGFVEQFGKQTCSQLPQDQTLQDFQKPPLQSFQATQMDLNQQLLSAHQISTQPNQVGMDEPSLEGFQGFLQAGPQNHIGLNVSNDMQPRLQQQSPANLNTPNSFVHFSSQDSMELNANSQLQFGQTLAGPCAQNLMGHSLQQNAVGSRGLFDHGQPQIPQNNMDGYSQNQITPNPQANNGQPNPLALQSQLQKSQLMPAQQLLNPMSSTEDSQWVTSTSNTNYTQNHQQVPMSAQNELQRDLLSLPQNTLMMNQLPKQHHHQANLVQRMQQLQPQAVTQNGQLYPTESHQERVLGVQPIVSYSQTQELQSIPQISSLLAQNSPFQQCGLGFGPQQISKVYQTPVGSAGLPSTSSCMFKSNSSPPMNGVQFSSMEHSTPSCLNIKPPPNQIPLQASCYYQTKPSEPIVGTTVIAQDDISISPPSCQFQPGFPPEILLEQCFINCNGQTPQPGHPMEENGELPYTALPNGNTYFPKHSGQANCCDY